MSVGGSETRAWELVKEGPGLGRGVGGGGLVARQPPDQRRMLIGLCVCISGERVNPRSVDLILDHGEGRKRRKTDKHIESSSLMP